MKVWVIDTSALVRLYIPDGPLPDGVEAAVAAASRGDALLLAPELLLAEVGQVLLKKERRGELSDREAEQILDAVLRLPLELRSHLDLIPQAGAIARRTGLTVHDGLFAALAFATGATLLTSDDALAAALS